MRKRHRSQKANQVIFKRSLICSGSVGIPHKSPAEQFQALKASPVSEQAFNKKNLQNSKDWLLNSEAFKAMSQAAKKISQFEKILEDKKAHPSEAPIYWFIARGSTLKGPFTIEELQEKLESNDVSIFDYAWRQGFSEWRNLGSVSEIQKKSASDSFEPYPNIPVPGKLQVAPTSEKEENLHQLNVAPKKRRDIEVRLRAAGKSWFTVRQSFFMVLFAMGVAHTTLS